jgi:transposase-like protein
LLFLTKQVSCHLACRLSAYTTNGGDKIWIVTALVHESSMVNRLRRRRPRLGDKWYLDEVFLTIHDERYYLWRAVDQEDHVLDILMQRRRNKTAAKKFFKQLLKGLQYVPRVAIRAS